MAALSKNSKDLSYNEIAQLIKNQYDKHAEVVNYFGNLILEMDPQLDVLVSIICYCSDDALYNKAWNQLIINAELSSIELVRIILTANNTERQETAWQLLSAKNPTSEELINIMCESANPKIQELALQYVMG